MTCIPDASTTLADAWRGCARGDWLELLTRHVPKLFSAAPVLVEVGANKGYAAPEFLSLWTKRSPSMQSWRAALEDLAYGRRPLLGETATQMHGFLKAQICGACSDSCSRARRPPMMELDGARVHLIELTKNNINLLRYAVNVTGSSEFVSVHHMAISNASGEVKTVAVRLGTEYTSVVSSRTPKAYRLEPAPVEQLPLDLFLDRMGLGVVDVVSIDTEGHDALVLEGMRRTLSERRVTLLEFEYSGKGFWNPAHCPSPADHRTLQRSVAWLDKLGYRCYMQVAGCTRAHACLTQAPCSAAPLSGS